MIVFDKPKALTDAPLHYCPGCTHGIIHRLVAEAIDNLGIAEKRQLIVVSQQQAYFIVKKNILGVESDTLFHIASQFLIY